MDAYFFLRQDLFTRSNSIEIVGHTDVSAAFNWLDGVRFDRPFPLETFLLDDGYGTEFPDFFDTTVPVMSARLLQALRTCGVDNIDAYPVVLRNDRDGSERTDYLAVNVVGLVDATDLAASEHQVKRGRPRFTGKVVIDPARAAGQRAFRLPFSPFLIVVHASVADALRPLGLHAVLLQNTLDYQGL